MITFYTKHGVKLVKTLKPAKAKKARPDLHDCAKGRMRDSAAQKIVTTMPGGYIA